MYTSLDKFRQTSLDLQMSVNATQNKMTHTVSDPMSVKFQFQGFYKP